MQAAGQLNKRVTIQSPSTTQDTNGEPIAGWTDVATVWASIVDITGREYLAAGGTQNQAQTKIAIRYRAGVVPSMRVLHDAVAYNIESVLGQDKKTLLLMCSRVA